MRRPATQSKPAPRRAPVSPVLLGVLLAMVTILAYLPALRGGFIWDDHSHVESNPSLFGPGGLKRIWFSLDAPQYYPLVFTSFRLERYRSASPRPLSP